MSIPLSALPAAADEWRRDRWGRYLILPPDEDSPVGYTRMTTVAKALDDGGGLANWKATLAICGVIMRRGLRTQWEAHIAQTNGDPWYHGQASKARCKALVEECATAGGATDRRDTGTSLHSLTALVDLDRPPTHLTPETERDLRAYTDTLAEAGITVVPGMVEQTIVIDHHRVAGTFDRLYSVPGFALPLIGDLKTGTDLSYSWQSIAVQLAGYSRGDALYRQGPAPDGSEDVRSPMPEVDQDHGLICWLNAGTGECELYVVNLTAGWGAFGHSMWARGWRKAEVSTRLADHQGDLATQLEASIAAIQPPPGETAPVVGGDRVGGGPEEDRSPSSPTGAAALPSPELVGEVRAWLQGRIDVIGAHPAARVDLGTSWPVGVPPLPRSDDHTAEQLEAIEVALNGVEKRHALPFPPEKPGVDYMALVLNIFPNTTIEERDNAS